MIAAERSGHDAGANRDAESVEPWETGDDATAQGGEEISDREVAAFAGHSPKNASDYRISKIDDMYCIRLCGLNWELQILVEIAVINLAWFIQAIPWSGTFHHARSLIGQRR